MSDGLDIRIQRSHLGRARGVGAAHSGVHHWRAERITSIALVPLTLWFVYSVIRLAGAPQEAVVQWAGHPVNTVLLLSLIAMTFHHMQLGLQVVLEDYVHVKWAMTASILAVKAGSVLLGLMASIAVLKLALG